MDTVPSGRRGPETDLAMEAEPAAKDRPPAILGSCLQDRISRAWSGARALLPAQQCGLGIMLHGGKPHLAGRRVRVVWVTQTEDDAQG
jgi:hypothetical protein